MLTLRKSLQATALLLALGLSIQATAHAEEDKPPQKRWEKLREHPVDYAPFQRRRTENLKSGSSTVTAALSQGFANATDIGSMPIITDPTLAKAISIYAQNLLPKALGLTTPQIEFVIVDDLGLFAEVQAAGQNSEAIQAVLAKDAANFTANSTGGGAIVLGISVLKTVRNFDELEFLLAHEQSHILYDHFTEDEQKQKISQAIGIGIMIASLVTRRSDRNTQDAVAWTSLGLVVANGFLGPAWDRAQEDEADELGFELMMESNKSVDGVRNIMERLQKREDAYNAYLDLMCGPDRAGVNFLKSLVGDFLGIKIPDKGYDPTNPVCEQRHNILASLLADHPDPADRRKNLEGYQKKYYADRKDVNLTPVGKASVIEFLSPNGESSRLVKAYDGLDAFRRGDIATARMLEKSLPSKGKEELQISVLELRYLVANADGQRATALKFLEEATLAPEPNLRLSMLAETEFARDQHWVEAAKIVGRRLQRKLAGPGEALPLQIRYLRRAGKKPEMEKLLLDCAKTDRPEVLLACEAVAHGPDTPDAPKPDAATPPADKQPAPKTPVTP